MNEINVHIGGVKIIPNPFNPNAELTGAVEASYTDKNNEIRTMFLQPGQDKHYLVIDPNMFKATGKFIVNFSRGAENVSQIFNVGPALADSGSGSNLNTISGCSNCVGGCGSSSGLNCTDSVIQNTKEILNEKIETVNTIKEQLQKEIKEQELCIADKVREIESKKENFIQEVSIDRQKIKNDVDTTLNKFSSDIQNIQYIKDELPSYKSIRTELEDYKFDRVKIEEKNEMNYENLKKTLKDNDGHVSELKAMVNSAELGSKQLEIYNQNIEDLKCQIKDYEKETLKEYNDVLNVFSEASLEISKFQRQVGTNKDNIDKLLETQKEWNTFKIKHELWKTSLLETLKNLDYTEEIQTIQDQLAKMEACCEEVKEDIKAIKDKLCEVIEPAIEELKKFKTKHGAMLDHMKAAGFDTLSPEQLGRLVANAKAGN